MPIEISEAESEKLAKITKCYLKIKNLIIRAEEEDPKGKTNPQILIELRNTLDHLMRFFIVKYDLRDPPPDIDYTIKTLEKTYGHIYRAGYDVLDWLAINLRKKVSLLMSKYSDITITTIYPEYYRQISPDIERISIKISTIREQKDIDNSAMEFQTFEEYIKVIDDLDQIYREDILPRVPALNDHKRKNWITRYLPWLVTVAVSITTAILGFVLKKC